MSAPTEPDVYSTHNRIHLDRDVSGSGIDVSTVWLGHPDLPGLLAYETVALGPSGDLLDQQSYKTEAEATAGHFAIVARVQQMMKDRAAPTWQGIDDILAGLESCTTPDTAAFPALVQAVRNLYELLTPPADLAERIVEAVTEECDDCKAAAEPKPEPTPTIKWETDSYRATVERSGRWYGITVYRVSSGWQGFIAGPDGWSYTTDGHGTPEGAMVTVAQALPDEAAA